MWELLRTDIFLVMAFTEIYLLKFLRTDLFLAISDFFTIDLNSTEIISLRHSDFFLELFKYSWREDMPNYKREVVNCSFKE